MSLKIHTVVQNTQDLDHSGLFINAKYQQMAPLAPLACHMKRNDMGAQIWPLMSINKIFVFEGFESTTDGVGITLRLLRSELICRPADNLDEIRLGQPRQGDKAAWCHMRLNTRSVTSARYSSRASTESKVV